MWRYIGPFRDPHRFEYYPGMTRHVAGKTAELLDTLSVSKTDNGIAELHHFVDQNNQRCSALLYRHDGAVCGFIRTNHNDIALPLPTAQELTDGARVAFPELFHGHKVPFAAISEADPVCHAPLKSAPSLSAASASSTSTKGPESSKAKPSSKSSA